MNLAFMARWTVVFWCVDGPLCHLERSKEIGTRRTWVMYYEGRDFVNNWATGGAVQNECNVTSRVALSNSGCKHRRDLLPSHNTPQTVDCQTAPSNAPWPCWR